jgi:hypothetical protein
MIILQEKAKPLILKWHRESDENKLGRIKEKLSCIEMNLKRDIQDPTISQNTRLQYSDLLSYANHLKLLAGKLNYAHNESMKT